MEAKSRIMPRRYKTLIATSYIIFNFLLISSIEAFHSPARQQLILPTGILFSHESKQNLQEPQGEKGEQNLQTPLRRYQGGMIQPVVIAAKSEETSSNFMKVNGQNISLNRKEGSNRSDFRSSPRKTETTMFRPSGMFSPPSVVRTNNDRSANKPVSTPRDELEAAAYVAGGKNEEEEEMKGTEEDTKQLATDAEEIAKKALKERKQIEAAVELNHLEIAPDNKIEAEVEAQNRFEQSVETNEKMVQNIEDFEDITEAEIKEIERNEERKRSKPEAIKKTEVEIYCEKLEEQKKCAEPDKMENAQKNPKSEYEEETNPLDSIEKNNAEDQIFNESETKMDVEAMKDIKSMYVDVPAMEKEEIGKLKAIQAMLQKRKEQQIELDEIEEKLLRKTNEIKKKREQLLRLEDEFARSEHSIRSNSNRSEESRPSETIKKIPYYSPKEYGALSPEEKKKLKTDRAALKNYNNSSKNNASTTNTVHPVLGPAIVDLGYKRVHIVSSGRLGTIPIWNKRQTYRFERVKRMAADKIDHMHTGFPGIICLHEDNKGKLSILDGQHRVGMMQALREDKKKLKNKQSELEIQGDNERIWKEEEKFFQNVLVEVYSELPTENATRTSTNNKNQSYAEQVFSEINTAEPMTLDNFEC